eukprot:jgi/Botrbrau1/16762/Bobra.0269s0004.2
MTGMVVACEGRRRAWCVDPSQKVRIFFCNLSNGVWLRRLRGDGGGGRWHFTIVSPRKRRRWLNARKGKFLGTGGQSILPATTSYRRHTALGQASKEAWPKPGHAGGNMQAGSGSLLQMQPRPLCIRLPRQEAKKGSSGKKTSPGTGPSYA